MNVPVNDPVNVAVSASENFSVNSPARKWNPERKPKIEFLLCGSPNDAFYSQTAMFRMALDSLGGIYQRARLVLCLGDHKPARVPARWRPYLRNVDVLWAPPEMFLKTGSGGGFRFDVMDASCDLSFMCDADTLILQAVPPDDLQRMIKNPALRGVLAHYPPPLSDERGNDHSALGSVAFWNFIADKTIGHPIEQPYQYSLQTEPLACPFYLNYGVLIGNFDHFYALYEQYKKLYMRIQQVINNRFFAQIGLTLGCAAGNIPTETLPMRYNFPNDPIADARYPQDLQQVIFMHYLRTNLFDRHKIFVDKASFDQFMQTPLQGSNQVFQERVRQITGAIYPFA
jgi:hypothetical protein